MFKEGAHAAPGTESGEQPRHRTRVPPYDPSMKCASTTKQLMILLGGLLIAVPSFAESPAMQAYEEVSTLRDRHLAVIWERQEASPEALRAILADLDRGLAQLAQPLNRDLAEGNVYLRYRRFNFLLDKAKLLARLGDKTDAIAALDDMSRISWLDPARTAGPEGDADLTPLLQDPQAATLRARYAAGRRFGDASALATPYREQLTAAEKAAGLSRIWSVARAGFVWFDRVPQLDWDRAYIEALPRVLAAVDTAAYTRELRRFVALLQDGHSNAYPPQALAERFYARPGLRTRRVEGQVIVTGVWDEGLAKQGLRVGDELLRVDGLAVDEHVRRHVQPYESSSTPQDLALRSYGYALLTGAAKQPVQLTLQHADGKRYTLRAPRSGYRMTAEPASESFLVRDDGVAVLKASQFENGAAAELMEQHIEAVKSAKALVIDLRGNGGGSSGHGLALLSWLQAGPLPATVSRVRDDGAYQQASLGPMAATSWSILPAGESDLKRPHHVDGPVAVLIDAGTFSAAEDTAAVFKLMRRGAIVGSASGGSTGQPLSFALPGGGSARICVKRDSYPDGSDFVGIGVLPDVAVQTTIAGLRRGQDEVLDAAVATLLKAR
jgi:carboxyl-terminal processing protease